MLFSIFAVELFEIFLAGDIPRAFYRFLLPATLSPFSFSIFFFGSFLHPVGGGKLLCLWVANNRRGSGGTLMAFNIGVE